MYAHVLVGIDTEEGGRDAIAIARELVAEGGKITLAHILSARPMSGHVIRARHEASATPEATRLLERVRAEAGIEADLKISPSPSVGRGLHLLADTLDCDLLVVGSNRRGLLGRLLVGDETNAALDGAPCAVVIAPAGYALHPRAIREIGVGYDESPESEYALGVARRLARQLDTKLSVFQAVAVPTYASVAGSAAVESPLETTLADARARLALLEDVEPHVVYGHPVEELALYSASLDLLVVGSRGYGPVGRLVHSATTRQLTRTARCPLLVIPRPLFDIVLEPTPALLVGEVKPGSVSTARLA